MTFDVAFIGTGADPETRTTDGFAMAYRHADAYETREDCSLVACADLVPENARAFARTYDIDEDHAYTDHREMLDSAEPDVVSVCVPPAHHAELTIDCARHDAVSAVHCEKPMALTWGECREMVRVCEAEGVQLTFNHQRRFDPAWRRAKEWLDAGEIGDLERIEVGAPNLYDWGTHSLDLCGFFVDEARPEWVIGQIDYREEQVHFGAHNENQSLACWQYETGAYGMASTGPAFDAVGCLHRLSGTDGTIEVRREWGHGYPDVRIRRAGDEWDGEETPEVDAIELAIHDLLDALREGRSPELDGSRALRSTELIFGTWESARRRGRVEFPLEIEDNPLATMVESGAIEPKPVDE